MSRKKSSWLILRREEGEVSVENPAAVLYSGRVRFEYELISIRPEGIVTIDYQPFAVGILDPYLKKLMGIVFSAFLLAG